MPTNPILAAKDPSILLSRVRQAFPDITWNTCTFIDAGWDHEVIRLDDQYIFRFPNSPEYLAKLRDEVALLNYFSAKTSARIPRYTFIARDYSFGGYGMLPGDELTVQLFHSLDEGQRDKIAKDIADFLSDLHSVDVAALSQFNISVEKDFGGYGKIEELAVRHLKPNLSTDDYRTITHMLADITNVRSYPQPACLTHGDIAPKHLLWDDEDEAVGFIDFSDRSITDPAVDFAELYTYGEQFAEQVYELYRGPEKQPQFMSRAKAYMKAIGINALVNAYRTDRMNYDVVAMELLRIGEGLRL